MPGDSAPPGGGCHAGLRRAAASHSSAPSIGIVMAVSARPTPSGRASIRPRVLGNRMSQREPGAPLLSSIETAPTGGRTSTITARFRA